MTPAEHERLSILLEELGEAVQVCGKILRHGYSSSNPLVANPPTNRQLLEFELGHVWFAMKFMIDANDLDLEKIVAHRSAKQESIKRWLHHN